MHNLKRKCPICENRTGEILNSQKFILPDNHPLKDGYDVVCCEACGFVFVNTAATQIDYDKFYSGFSKYEEGANIIGSGDSVSDYDRLSKTATYLTAKLGTQKKVLDVGCANGGLLRELKKQGCVELSGYDPSGFCVKYIQEKLGLEAQQGSIFEIKEKIKSEKYEVVLLSHVLEHLLDVQAALSNIKNIIADEGYLYLEVPDATKYAEYFVNPFHYFDTEHINHFSIHFLYLLASINGFSVIDEGFKEIALSDNTTYPAIYTLLKKNLHNTAEAAKSFSRDTSLKNSINEYIKKSLENFNLSIIDKIVNDGREYIFWGVGSTTLRILAGTDLKKAKIKYFVDNNPNTHGSTILNKKVYSPEELSGSNEPIVVFTRIYKNEILKQIAELGLTNEVILLN